jgi:DNA-directed RNA polymerase subunit D
MDSEIIEEDGHNIRILLKDTDRASVNALRRTMIGDTPKMAIHRIRFTQSTTEEDGVIWESVGPLPDEIVAHRLAMIPIPSDGAEFHVSDECPQCGDMVESQRGCPLCEIIYRCMVRGEPEGRSVKASDLEVLGDLQFSISEEFEDITITKLYTGQTIDFIARANKGYGRDHVKWQPVTGISFYARQHAVLNDKKAAKVLWSLGLTIKEKDFDKNGRIEDISLIEQMKEDLLHVGPSTDHGREFGDAITLEDVPGEFILQYESDGSMKARTIFEDANRILSARLDNISADLEEVL